MLDRPTTRRVAANKRQARYERRQRRGVGIYTIELDAGVVATLIPLGWLREVAETDRAAVGLAVTRALRELANWHHAPT
jgi:hypothetical protein